MNIDLSVVVPVYNVERYLRKCVDSLLNQSVKVKQIILVDDGSTDSSGTICEEYAKNYHSIITLHHENSGLGLTRNLGLANVKTKYVTFFDSDDFADIDYIETLFRPIIKFGADTCKGTYKRVDSYGNVTWTEHIIAGVYNNQEVITSLLPRMIGSAPDKKDSIPMSSCCTIYSTKIIKDNRIEFVSERNYISEDTLFNIEYLSYAKKVYVIDYSGYNYRVNQGSLTTKYIPNRFDRCKLMVLHEREVLEQKKIYHLCKDRLSRQFFNYLRMCFYQLKTEISGLDYVDCVNEIAKICNDELVQSIIRDYPKSHLSIKQYVFLYLVRLRCYRIIFFLYNKFGLH